MVKGYFKNFKKIGGVEEMLRSVRRNTLFQLKQ